MWSCLVWDPNIFLFYHVFNILFLIIIIIFFIYLFHYSPGGDSENLNFVAPPEEDRFYGIFCFFGSPAFILKTIPLSKCVRKTLEDP